MQLEPGSKLGQYEIISSLGAGGMGEVYRARDSKLGREVAIKLLLEEVSQDAERLARFEREAKVLASLNHNNIATLYGFETEGDKQFLVMEVVEGETLADRIQRGAIPVDDALPLFLQIAEGLEAAHEKGVIHRDLKPANIKITSDADPSMVSVKILDFGLAKAMLPGIQPGPSAAASMSPTLTLAATQRGEILGTAAYMSPEQARGLEIDKRADVWAFGACLFEALAGQRAFEGEDASLILAAVLTQEPTWDALPPDLPRPLRKLVQRCLEKRARNRLHDVADARLELEELLSNPSGEAEPAPGTKTRPAGAGWPWLAAAAIAGASLAGLAAWFMRPATTAPILRSVLSSPYSLPVGGGGPDTDVRITRDGSKVVYRVSIAGRSRAYVRPVDRLVGEPITPEEVGAVHLFLSPDGEWVGFMDSRSRPYALKKVSIRGGPVVQIPVVLETGISGATWGTDDTIVFSTGDALHRIAASGGESEVLYEVDPEQASLALRFPSYLPGNAAIVLTLLEGGQVEEARIAIFSLDTGELKTVLSGGSDAQYVASGHLVYGVEGTLRAVPFDLDRLEVTGGAVPVVEGVATDVRGAANFSVSEDGSLAYVAGPSSATLTSRRILLVDPEGRQEDIGLPPGPYQHPRVSPDGSRMTLTVGKEGGNDDIWVWDFERHTFSRLTFDEAEDQFGEWSPDGREIIFHSARGGRFGIYRRSADGTGEVETMSTSAVDRVPAAVSPDGRFVVLRDGGRAQHDLSLLSLDGGEDARPLLASRFGERQAKISPDGRWMAYISDESGRWEVYVRPFPDVDSARYQISTAGGSDPLWSVDGTKLYFVRELYDSYGAAILAVGIESEPSFRAGVPETLFEIDSVFFQQGTNWDLLPDGRFVIISPSVDRSADSQREVVLVQNWFEELKRLVPTD